MPPRKAANVKPKRPQGRPSIFNDGQLSYLKPFVPAYKNASGPRRAKPTELWQEIFGGFFERWPIEEPTDVDYEGCTTEEQRAKRREDVIEGIKKVIISRVKSWMTRQTQAQNQRNVWSAYILNAIRPKKGAPRPFTESTMYKFYMTMDEYKDKVDDLAQEQLGDRKITREEVLPHWCGAAKELWDEEEEEVREEVRRAAAVSYAERKAAYDNQGITEDMTVEERQAARSNMGGALEPWMEEIMRIIGSNAATFITGIAPTAETPYVQTIAVHVGRTTASNGLVKFDKFKIPEYDSFVHTFGQFVEHTTDKRYPPIRGPEGDAEDDLLSNLIQFEERALIEGIPGSPPPPVGSGAAHIREGNAPVPASGEGRTLSSTLAAAAGSMRAISGATSAPTSSQTATPSVAPTAAASSSTAASTLRATEGASRVRAASTSPAAQAAPPPAPVDKSSAPRARPRPTKYDVPEVFDSYKAKGQKLGLPLRALLQRMPPSKREGRLSQMMGWDAYTFKQANKLAQDDAELSGPSPTRDSQVLKEIFKNWDRARQNVARKERPVQTKGKRKRNEDDDDEYEDDDEHEDDDEGGNKDGGAMREGVEGEGTEQRPARRSMRRKVLTKSRGARQPAEKPPSLAPAPARPQAASESNSAAHNPGAASRTSRASSRLPQAPASTRTSATPQDLPSTSSGNATQGTNVRGLFSPSPDRVPPCDDLHPGLASPRPSTPRDASPASPSDNEDVDMGDETREEEHGNAGSHEHGDETREDEHGNAGGNKHGNEHGDEHGDESRSNSHDKPRDPSPKDDAPASPLALDVDEFPWMANCLKSVNDLDGTEDDAPERLAYLNMMKLWIELERANGFKDSGKHVVAGANRPIYVGEWIQRARSSSYEPNLLKPKARKESDAEATNANWDKFRASMAAWWRQINPEWRTEGVDDAQGLALTRGEGDLMSLYCTGQNGLVSVVVSLRWWWELFSDPLVEEQEGDRAAWCAAVDDVSWAFSKMLKQIRDGAPIPSAPNASRPIKRRKARK